MDMVYNRYKVMMMAVLLFVFAPVGMRSQSYIPDFASIEAFIHEHKQIRSVLLARSNLEVANKVLHKNSMETGVEFDSLNVKLDKYTKCFNIIDNIYNGVVTVSNAVQTGQDVSEKIGKMTTLIGDFVELRTLRGDILSSDDVIFTACQRSVSRVADEVDDLLLSLGELSQYVIKEGGREITSEGLFTVFSSINEHLDNIRAYVDECYNTVWKYIYMRTHFFKKAHYQAKTIREMAHDAAHAAFERWRGVRRRVGYQ